MEHKKPEPWQIEARLYLKRDLKFIEKAMSETPPAFVSKPPKDDVIQIAFRISGIRTRRYIENSFYPLEMYDFIEKALSLANEYLYLDDIYKDFGQDRESADDFQAMDRIQACINDQNNKYGLDRTSQIEKYLLLLHLKRKYNAQKHFEFNDAELEANNLIAELRADIKGYFDSAILDMMFLDSDD